MKNTGTIERKNNQKHVYTLNVGTIEALKRRARKIRSLYASVEALAQQAREKCNATVAEAILLGQELNATKQLVGHGAWLAWLKENVKGITDRTARRYMALSNRSHVSDLGDGDSLRQAYVAVGIIKENDPAPAPSKPVESPTAKEVHQPLAGVSIAPVGPSLAPVAVITTKAGKQVAVEGVAPQEVDVLPVIASSVEDLLTLLSKVPKARRHEARAAIARLTAWLD